MSTNYYKKQSNSDPLLTNFSKGFVEEIDLLQSPLEETKEGVSTVIEQEISLFEQLGGSEAIKAIVDQFYERVLADSVLKPYFAKINIERLKGRQTMFFTQVLGGPAVYKGRDINKAQEKLAVEPMHFDLVAGHLIETLKSLGVSPQYIEAVIQVITPLAPDIVNTPTTSKESTGNGHKKISIEREKKNMSTNHYKKQSNGIPLLANSSKESAEKTDILQARLEEAKENASATIRIVEVLATAQTMVEVTKMALDTVRSAFGWAYGSYWVLDPKDNVLKFSVESGSVNWEFQKITTEAHFREGEGLSGKAWKSRDLLFVDDIGKMTDCCRASIAQRAGVKSGLCFPIIVNGTVVGTMDFFALETLNPTPERFEALHTVNRLVSAAFERIKASEEQAIIKTLVENAPTNLMYANLDLKIQYINPASIKTLKGLEAYLPVKVDQILGKSIDIFHKNPERIQQLVADPRNLPYKADISLGPETLHLLISPMYDQFKKYLGPMLTWEVLTEKLAAQKLAQDQKLAQELAEREKQQTTELKAQVEKILSVVETLANSSEELTAVSKQMGLNADETCAQANVVSVAAEQVSHNVQTVATATEEMSASIREIARSASDSARVAASAVKVAEKTNTTVTKLGESSAEIGKVIKVITSIAQQTNLLALNATIEAARAGEAGKGFAVVANEVKELAKATAKATEDISQKIEAIQTDTKGAVEAITQISNIINNINDISSTIASAVEEQTATTNEIGRNVTEAAKGSTEIAKNITMVANNAAVTSIGAKDTKKAAEELSKMANQLQNMVSYSSTSKVN